MSACPLIVELVIVFLLTLFLLNKYGDIRRQNPLVTVSTFVGWYFSFLIIFVLPMDIAITFYNRCLVERQRVANQTGNTTMECEEPGGYVEDRVLLTLWRVVYWTAQLLTWIILPLLQSYHNAGDFTKAGRLKAALYNNAVYYACYAGIFIAILFYAILKGVDINAEHLKVILVSASNSWGLFLLVLLLGFGLVEVPRMLWHSGHRDYRLNRTYFNVDKLSSGKHDADEECKDAYREARSVLNVLQNERGLREKAQLIVARFPEEAVQEMFPGRNPADFNSLSADEARSVTSEKYLIRLHKRVISAVQGYQRTQAQWRSTMARAQWLEDVQQAAMTGSLPARGYSILPDSLRHAWYVTAQTPVCKALGVLLCGMTILILVSECTFFITSPTLSPAALILHHAAERFHYKYTQLISMFILAYLCVCAYLTVFRLRIYKYYHLDPHRMTDENSLLFSAILLCRLTPPICLNLLGMIHLDSHIAHSQDYGVEPQFTRLMGHLDVLPMLAKGINIYLPIMILVFCAVNYYKLGTYLLHVLGFDQFVDDDDFTLDMVAAGKSLVQLDRSKQTRRVNRERREEQWDKFSAAAGSAAGRIRSLATRQRSPEREPIIAAEEGMGYESGSEQQAQRREEEADPFANSSSMFDDM